MSIYIAEVTGHLQPLFLISAILTGAYASMLQIRYWFGYPVEQYAFKHWLISFGMFMCVLGTVILFQHMSELSILDEMRTFLVLPIESLSVNGKLIDKPVPLMQQLITMLSGESLENEYYPVNPPSCVKPFHGRVLILNIINNKGVRSLSMLRNVKNDEEYWVCFQGGDSRWYYLGRVLTRELDKY